MSQDIYDDNGFRLFEYDQPTGRSVWVKHEVDGKMTFRIDTPVSQILDANKDAANESMGKRFGDWRRVASIPLDMMDKSGLSEANIQKDGKFISRWLNDGDNRKFRTFGGIV